MTCGAPFIRIGGQIQQIEEGSGEFPGCACEIPAAKNVNKNENHNTNTKSRDAFLERVYGGAHRLRGIREERKRNSFCCPNRRYC